MYKENPPPHRYVFGKGRRVLKAFSDGYSYLMWYQNSVNGSFLKVCFIVESETILMNFLYSTTLKSTGSCYLNGSSTHA